MNAFYFIIFKGNEAGILTATNNGYSERADNRLNSTAAYIGGVNNGSVYHAVEF